MIKRRHFFHFSGYDPVSPADLQRRFAREYKIYLAAWKLSGDISETADPRLATVTTSAPNWRTETVYEQLPWDDIIRHDAEFGMLTRLGRGARAFASIIGSGTLLRYLWAFPQYGIFCLFPFVAVIGFAVASIAAGRVLARIFGLGGMSGFAVTAIVAVPLFFALFHWIGQRWRIWHALDDWSFSADCMAAPRADISARIDQFATRLIEVAASEGVEEIVIAGHSLGASFTVEMIARALAKDPQLGTRGARIALLTVGATIPKFALHPRGAWIRESAARLASERSIAWTEYHDQADAISFYKFDPVALEPVSTHRFDSKPVIRIVHIKDLVQSATLKRLRRSRMRLHYQSVMANDRRGNYDYYMFVCGPLDFGRVSTAMEGYLEYMGLDGAVIASALPPVPVRKP